MAFFFFFLEKTQGPQLFLPPKKKNLPRHWLKTPARNEHLKKNDFGRISFLWCFFFSVDVIFSIMGNWTGQQPRQQPVREAEGRGGTTKTQPVREGGGGQQPRQQPVREGEGGGTKRRRRRKITKNKKKNFFLPTNPPILMDLIVFSENGA